MSEEGANGWRRWTDKALIGVLGVTLALVAVIYTHTRGDIADLRGNLGRLDATERERGERIKALEEGRVEMKGRLERIETKLDRLLERDK